MFDAVVSIYKANNGIPEKLISELFREFNFKYGNKKGAINESAELILKIIGKDNISGQVAKYIYSSITSHKKEQEFINRLIDALIQRHHVFSEILC